MQTRSSWAMMHALFGALAFLLAWGSVPSAWAVSTSQIRLSTVTVRSIRTVLPISTVTFTGSSSTSVSATSHTSTLQTSKKSSSAAGSTTAKHTTTAPVQGGSHSSASTSVRGTSPASANSGVSPSVGGSQGATPLSATATATASISPTMIGSIPTDSVTVPDSSATSDAGVPINTPSTSSGSVGMYGVGGFGGGVWGTVGVGLVLGVMLV